MASTSNTSSDTEAAVANTERPNNLFNATTPTNIAASGGCISPSATSRTTPSFLPEMPQWKKDLIQRRKSNVSRTLNAGAVTPTSTNQQKHSIIVNNEQPAAGDYIELSKPTAAAANQPTKSSQQFSHTSSSPLTERSSMTMPAISREYTAKLIFSNNTEGRGHTTISTKDEQQDKTSIEARNQEVEYEFEKIKRRMENEQNQNGNGNNSADNAASLQSGITSPNKILLAASSVSPILMQQQQKSSLCSSTTTTATTSSSSLSESLTRTTTSTTRIITSSTNKNQIIKSEADKSDTTYFNSFTIDSTTSATNLTCSADISGGRHFQFSSVPIKMINTNETTLKEESENAAGEPTKTKTTTTLLSATGFKTALERENDKHDEEQSQSQLCIGEIVGSASERKISNQQEIREIETEISIAMTTTTTTSTKSTIGAISSCLSMEHHNNQSHFKSGCERTLPLSINSNSPLLLSSSTPPPLLQREQEQDLLQSYQEEQAVVANIIEKKQRNNSFDKSPSQQQQQLQKSSAVNGCGNSGFNNGSNATPNSIISSGNSNVKISSKLQNNQFIKNQQNPLNIQTTAKYLKYKSHSIQEPGAETATCAGNFESGVNTVVTPIGSPNKLTSVGITKKMVAIQDTKKTTQNANIHSHHPQQIIGNATLCSPTRSNTTQQQQQQQQQQHQHRQINVNDDGNEDLAYGPGIVSKLRCRYLSLALRESMENQNHCIENLRRATSLNNLLDRDDDDEEVVVVMDDISNNVVHQLDDELKNDEKFKNVMLKKNNNHSSAHQSDIFNNVTNVSKKTAIFQKNTNVTATATTPPCSQSNGGSGGSVNTNGVNNMNRYSCETAVKIALNNQSETSSSVAAFSVSTGKESPRSRHNKRGNDSLKRARSVEALLCEKSQWNSMSKKQVNTTTKLPTCVTIEDKINNARDRLISGLDTMPPKRLQSIISDTERPPTDVVKQTLKIFEASAHRRIRPNSKGEVASKVANYKSIINENKTTNAVYAKPSLSPTKKLLNSSICGGGTSRQATTTKPVIGAVDLLSSPIGRKTTANAAAAASLTDVSTPSLSDLQNTLHSSTPKTKIANNLEYNTPLNSVINSDNVSPSCNTPDNILRQKLLPKKKSERIAAVDSPLTSLSKKLEMLNIETEEQQQIVLSGGEVTATTTNTHAADGAQELIDKQQLFNIKAAEGGGGANKNDMHVGVGSDGGGVGSSISSVGGESINDVIVVTDVVDLNDKSDNNNAANNDDENNESIKNDRETAVISADTNGGCGGSNSSSSYNVEFDIEPPKANIPTSCDLSDCEYGSDSKKLITKTALDNIARAGTTQQYKFSATNSATAASTSSSSSILKSSILKPNYQITSIEPIQTSTSLSSTTSSSLEIQSSSTIDNCSISKQIGIRSYETATIHHPNNQDQIHMETLKQQQQQLHQQIYANKNNTHSHNNHHITSTYTSPLTSREIEKNRINEMKKTAAAGGGSNLTASSSTLLSVASSSNASLSSSSSIGGNNTLIVTSSLDTVINTKTSSTSQSSSGFHEIDAMSSNNSPLWALRKKRQTPNTVVDNSSMVFNFQNRKEVPDYIENDGVIFRRKRELPKPNESGFVLLGDLSLETSTDTDYDDFSMCPPSPCDVEFEGANIVIDGKSSLRQKPKEATFRVQFNDTLTSTFEYPSEASLVIEDCYVDPQNTSGDDLVNAFELLRLNEISSPSHIQNRNNSQHVAVADEIIPLPIPVEHQESNVALPTSKTSATKNVMGNLPLGSAPLGFYTPVKAPIDYIFQLGVTRVPSTNVNDTAKGMGGSITTDSCKINGNNITTAADNCHADSNVFNVINNGFNETVANANLNGECTEPESLQYLKPANDDLTVAYSEGTHETDLLY